MEGADKYPRWVGVLLSLFFPGAGQYLAGDRGRGVCWFLTLVLGLGVVVFLLAESAIPSLVPAAVAAAVLALLWLYMLWDARRPVERVDFLTLGVLLALGAIVLCLTAWFWLRWGAEAAVVPNNSMAPTLQRQLRPGRTALSDVVVVQKWAYLLGKPRRGDLVFFRTDGLGNELPPGKLVMRVVALPDEEVSFVEGRLAVGGRLVTDPPIFGDLRYKLPANGPFLTTVGRNYRVPIGQYLVFADNTAELCLWGPVPAANILGRVSRICWPWSRVTTFR
jgi:signal peptidase I